MSNLKAQSEIKVSVLNNGVRVVTAALPTSTALMTVFAKTGARRETPEINGISHFLEHMAFKGTTKRDAKNIALEVEILGADVNAFTSELMTGYQITGTADDITTALDILSDVVTDSVFPQDELDRERGVVIEEIGESHDDIHDIAYEALLATAYPDQAYGRPILGPVDNINAFTREMLQDYMAQNYGGTSLLVIGTGDVDHDSFVAEATKRFGHIIEGSIGDDVTLNYVGGVKIVKDDRFKQAQILIAAPVPGALSPEAPAFIVLSEVLGGGMSAPLFQEVREKRGLCYSVGSTILRQPDESLLMIYGSASAPNVEEFVNTALEQLVVIANGTIDDNDWTRAHNTIKRQLLSSAEKPGAITKKVAADLYMRGEIISMDDVLQRTVNLTKADIVSAAQSVLETVPSMVVAGGGPDIDYAAILAKYFNA